MAKPGEKGSGQAAGAPLKIRRILCLHLLKTLLELLRPFGILEVVRTGRIAMDTTDKGLNVEGKPEVNE